MGRIKKLFPTSLRNSPPLAKHLRFQLPGRIRGASAGDGCSREFEELMECYVTSNFDERKCFAQHITMEKCMTEFMVTRKKRPSVRFHASDTITRRLPFH